jgi:hypothetical protein
LPIADCRLPIADLKTLAIAAGRQSLSQLAIGNWQSAMVLICGTNSFSSHISVNRDLVQRRDQKAFGPGIAAREQMKLRYFVR